MKNDLEKLVREAQTGNGKAFASVYSFYATDLYKFALWFTGNSADAQDCVQEAVLLSFQNISKLQKPSAFRSWMFRILSNVCKNRLTDPAVRLCSVSIHEVQETADDIDFTDTGISLELRDALSRLSDDERQIVLLSVIGGYKSGEIGKMLDMTAGSVRSKLSRSLDKLRDILQ